MIQAHKPVLLFSCALLATGVLAISPAMPAGDSAAIQLAPHRAVYDLSLKQSRLRRGAQTVTGRIYYDFSGNSCEGYASQFRQVSKLDNGEGQAAVNDLRAVTWESGTATSYRFNSQSLLNEEPVEAVDGQAERGQTGVAVDLTKPAQKKFQMDPDMVFPTEHIRRILSAAHAGKTLLSLPVYDGSENGEKVFNTLTVIGRALAPNERVPTDAAAGQSALAGMTRWPVTISYFDVNAKPGEQTPDYSLSFELYDNGIARAFVIDYGDFVLRGEMTSLEIGSAKPCQ